MIGRSILYLPLFIIPVRIKSQFCKKMSVSCGSGLQILRSVAGFHGQNDLLYHPPKPKPQTDPNVVVYFGGDVQDFQELMEKHRDNKRHINWSLEKTVQLLSTKFPSSHVFVVRPSLMHLGTFARYQNFVACNLIGVPEFGVELNAFKQLESLLRAAFGQIRSDFDASDFRSYRISIIGFSKGSVVLNQMLHELPIVKDNPSVSDFLKQIEAFYWLDGGHGGSMNTWVTDRNILQELCAMSNVRLHVHVTPYQINDNNRPWIGREQKKFCSILQRLGANLESKVHFEDENPSLENHFRVLEEFESDKEN